ncbi:MAG: hypothetical protein ACOC7Y_01800 [Chloroflexota bacterium]
MSKFSLDVLEKRVFPYVRAADPDVVLGAAFGEDVASASRAVAAPVGVALYAAGDIRTNGPVSAAACFLLLLVLLRLRERGR